MSEGKETTSTVITNKNVNNSNNSVNRSNSYQKEIPFNYQKFLEQMNHKNAIKIVRYVRNFELEFERYPRAVSDQIKFVHEFLDFIAGKMRECELWKNATEQEFENAREGMEKLVMSLLYKLTFTPAIKEPPVTDDIESDNILHQKIEIFRWVREQHLDIPITSRNESFLNFAKKELLKINNYKAPRDKLICILNCCKGIYGLIKYVNGEEGADKFLPVLIFVILKANPEHLMSNVQFRSPEKLQSEAGYYLSSLMSAISFIENMDAPLLTITKEEFDKNIEMTVKELDRERPKPLENTREINYENTIHPSSRSIVQNNHNKGINHAKAKAIFEKGTIIAQKSIQRPLNVVGKILSDFNQDLQEHVLYQLDFNHNYDNNNDTVSSPDTVDSLSSTSSSVPRNNAPINTANATANLTANPSNLPRRLTISELLSYKSKSLSSHNSRDYAHVQEEVARVTDQDIQKSLESLKSMFPDIESDLCGDIFYGKECNMNEAIDKLLEISTPFSIKSANVYAGYKN
ncbi:15917_t:CDS:10 [Entrophospora sp. SA101]|nr:15917_t:CDS:10 [Entrophospora sp. SA101]